MKTTIQAVASNSAVPTYVGEYLRAEDAVAARFKGECMILAAVYVAEIAQDEGCGAMVRDLFAELLGASSDVEATEKGIVSGFEAIAARL